MHPSPKVGCCGFPLKKPEYAKQFSVVEVQQTFYQPPKIATLEKWRSLVPEEFEFTLKAWQLITHSAKSPTYRRLKIKLTPAELEQCGSFQDTEIVQRAWQTTFECAIALRARYVLFQCPASFAPTDRNISQMRHFFMGLEKSNLKLLWEPRGNWPEDIVRSLCEELNLIHAVDPFISQPATSGLLYFRLHGGKGFRHVFTDDELAHLAALIKDSERAYVMFNNIAMLQDAKRFQALLNSRLVGIPA